MDKSGPWPNHPNDEAKRSSKGNSSMLKSPCESSSGEVTLMDVFFPSCSGTKKDGNGFVFMFQPPMGLLLVAKSKVFDDFDFDGFGAPGR